MEADNSRLAIRIQALRKTFRAQLVLNGIALNVARGETLVIMQPRMDTDQHGFDYYLCPLAFIRGGSSCHRPFRC